MRVFGTFYRQNRTWRYVHEEKEKEKRKGKGKEKGKRKEKKKGKEKKRYSREDISYMCVGLWQNHAFPAYIKKKEMEERGWREGRRMMEGREEG
jgi:hypothetical protein